MVTETLVDLLKIHSRTPLVLTDMRQLFVSGGILRLNEHLEFDARRSTMKINLSLSREY